MKKTDFFLTSLYIFLGFTIWFFPKQINSVQFLGYSKPLVLNKSSIFNKANLKSRKSDMQKKRNLSSIKDSKP